jgi:putative Holliday junction resolvase
MKILSVDLGDARTGLACCDATERLASPVEVIHEKDPDRLLEKVCEAARRLEVTMAVVGHPVNMNGSLGPRAQAAEEFARRLENRLNLPVRLWDERCTTVSAHGILNAVDVRGKKRRELVDAVAAVVILEGFLVYRKNNPDAHGIK